MSTPPGGKQKIVVVGGGLKLEQLSSHPFVARTFDVTGHAGADGVAEFLQAQQPNVIICSLLVPQTQFHALVSLVKARPFPCSVVLFAPRDASARLEARAASVRGAFVLFGRHRLFPRLIESLAVATGASLRVHLRADLQAPLELITDGAALAGRLLNLSESGAKIATSRVLDVGEQVTLSFQEEEHLTLRARVVRTVSTPLGPAAGIAFEPMTLEERALFGRLRARVEASAPTESMSFDHVRSARRYSFAGRRVEARLTLRNGERMGRLMVKDVSERGCGLIGPATALAKLTPGAPLMCFLFDRDRLFKVAAEVVHVMPHPQDAALCVAGLKFMELTAQAKARLLELIQLWSAPRRGRRERGSSLDAAHSNAG